MSTVDPTYWTDNFIPDLFNGRKSLYELRKNAFSIKSLPDELLIKMFSCLSSNDYVEDFMLVCRKWHDLIKQNEAVFRRRSIVSAINQGGAGNNMVIRLSGWRECVAKERSILLDFRQPRPDIVSRIIRTSIFSFDGFLNDLDETNIHQFQEDWQAMFEFFGSRPIVEYQTLTFRGPLYTNMDIINGTLQDSDSLHVDFISAFSFFREFWVSGKAKDMLKFQAKSNLNITISYRLGEDEAWDPAISDAISDFISSPVKKSHLSFLMHPFDRHEDKARLLAAAIQYLQLCGQPLDHVSMLTSNGFVFDHTEPGWYGLHKMRVFRMQHPRLKMALEVSIELDHSHRGISRHSHILKLKCVNLPSEARKKT